MAAGFWLDGVLAILAVATLVVLYRVRSKLPAPGTAPAPDAGKVLRRLGTYYPTVSRQAGFDPGGLRWGYWVAKLALGSLLPLLVMEVQSARGTLVSALWLAVPALIGFLLPDAWLLNTRRRRQWRVKMAVSFFLDLLVALLHSGLGLEEAFRRAGRGLRFGRSHPLVDEVELVAFELDIGKDRGAAFQALAERTGVTELKGVAAALRQGMRLGTSVESTLAAQADILRLKRREEALSQINRAAVQALVPTLLCGFPILMLLIFFPAALELLEALEFLQEILR